ncbi:hypothetical protein Gotri_005934 [Gossypium trilobum]|uniref:CCHC-type domain-containing protein n=1 Tax=Gossypium trilobum TaxID=34281 RepID=A0A7J9EYN0_9ROSI|nr:hypothetical protein [Gossypium trilobum]
MIVFINLEKLLVSQVLINGKLQRIECGRYGHLKEACPQTPKEAIRSGEKNPVSENHRSTEGLKIGNDEYGSWMLVEKRTRRNPRDQNSFGKSGYGEKSKGF